MEVVAVSAGSVCVLLQQGGVVIWGLQGCAR